MTKTKEELAELSKALTQQLTHKTIDYVQAKDDGLVIYFIDGDKMEVSQPLSVTHYIPDSKRLSPDREMVVVVGSSLPNGFNLSNFVKRHPPEK